MRKSYIYHAIAVVAVAITAVTVVATLSATGTLRSRCADADLVHLNPQILCGATPAISKKNYVEFKLELEKFIREKKESGEAAVVAIYFRDLLYGPTFGIEEYTQFSPASLLKLPLLLAYLSIAEDRPNFLETEIFFEGYSEHLAQSVAPKVSAKAGVHYTLLELLELMIKYSDNNSYYALLAYLDEVSPNRQLLRDTFLDLGVIDPQSTLEDTITVKSYAGIFTQLFNSSYFSRKETSEEALTTLTDTDYAAGLVAGVPVGTKVAHKFGERYDAESNLKQLHDCGIVYFPENPYLLCIMTRGDDMEELTAVLREVSRMVYAELDSRRLE
jgi:beta-lactamase class A